MNAREVSMLRSPAVSGYFYKGSPDALKKQVEGFLLKDASRRKAIGVVAPHAGLIYSGPVAGALYSSIEIPDTVILVGPNHTGLGAAVSIMTNGTWETPLGSVEIDSGLADSILSHSRRVREDTLAHIREHSLEVQLPFIQYFKKDFKIVPIQMLDTRLDTCLDLGKALAAAFEEKGQGKVSAKRDILIVASSDMSHYETAERAKEKDFKAIQQILDLDPEGLYHVIRDYDVTMCGYGPAIAMLLAAKSLGATKAELIKYSNSGETSGDYEKVVGYAGIVIM
jgi:AmmeMemoRadiSam system protein B